MAILDAVAIIATLLTAFSVLPGTLGILMLTNNIAASAAGARFIYFQSGALLAVALLLISYVAYRSFQADAFSALGIGSMVTVALLLAYGFLMHAKLLFKPVTKPKYASLDEAIEKFGADEEVIGVIDRNGNPYAYIARLARRPHIVFQPEGDAPFIMSHCILAHSSMSYALEGNFSDPDVTITAALANNMVFYGTEVLMSHTGSDNDGIRRSDFPGGWAGDKKNAFTGEGLSVEEKQAQSFVRTLTNWRKDKTVIHAGKLMHFVPYNGVYVYVRYDDNNKVMVALNKNEQPVTLDKLRYAEQLDGHSTAFDVLTGTRHDLSGPVEVPARGVLLLELK